jgi:hypothetical protein
MERCGETGRERRCLARMLAASDCEACSVAASLYCLMVSLNLELRWWWETAAMLSWAPVPPLHNASRRLNSQCRSCRPSQAQLEDSCRSHDCSIAINCTVVWSWVVRSSRWRQSFVRPHREASDFPRLPLSNHSRLLSQPSPAPEIFSRARSGLPFLFTNLDIAGNELFCADLLE